MTSTSTPIKTEFEVVIGLEVHSQLLTRSKMFCSCSTNYANAAPNTYVCPVCMGMPGVLPVINDEAITYTIMTALALHCSIPEYSKFDRKSYHYPDLMKGYQISQYDIPLSRQGYLTIDIHVGRNDVSASPAYTWKRIQLVRSIAMAIVSSMSIVRARP